MRPVSNTMRRQVGAFANSLAIASAVNSVLLSRATTPSRSRTQTCIIHRDIEASKIVHVVSSSASWPILSAFAEASRPLPDVEKVGHSLR